MKIRFFNEKQILFYEVYDYDAIQVDECGDNYFNYGLEFFVLNNGNDTRVIGLLYQSSGEFILQGIKRALEEGTDTLNVEYQADDNIERLRFYFIDPKTGFQVSKEHEAGK